MSGNWQIAELRIDDQDVSHLVRFEPHQTHVDFEVYAAAQWGPEMRPEFSLRDGDGSRYTTDPDEAERLLHGCIKWDGCSHVYFGESEGPCGEGYIHLCGQRCFLSLCKVLQAVWNLCIEKVGSKNGELKPWEGVLS